MLAHHSLCNYLVISFILTTWIDTVVISMDVFRDRKAIREYGIEIMDDDVPSGSNIRRENTPKATADVINVSNDDVPSGSNIQRENTSEDIRQLDDEGTITSLKNWGIDASFEKLIRITNLHATNPKKMTKEVMKAILGENKLRNMVIQREKDFDAVYSLIPKKVKTFVFDYVNLHSHSKINNSTFEAAVNQLFNDIRDGNKINEVVTIDSSSSEEENDVLSPAGENEGEDILEETKPLLMNDVHTRPVNEPPEWMTCIPSVNCKVTDDMDDINDDIPSGSNKRRKPSTDIQKRKKLNLCPYQKKGVDKVELVKGTKVWISKKELESYVKNLKKNPNELSRMLLQSLIGKDNLKNYSLGGKNDYIRIPNIVKETIFEFVNEKLKPKDKIKYAKFQKVIKNFLQKRFRGKEDVTSPPLEDSVSNTLEPPEVYPYQIRGADKVELTKGSKIWINKKTLQTYTTYYKTNPLELMKFLLKNLIPEENLPIFTWSDNKSRYKMIPYDVKEAIITYVNKNVEAKYKMDIKKCNAKMIRFVDNIRRISAEGIISKKGKIFDIGKYIHKKPETFPYEEKKRGKIELVPKSKVWIEKGEFKKLNEDLNINAPRLIYKLLEILLGKENMKFFSIKGKHPYIQLPTSVSDAIYDFINKRPNFQKKISEKEYALMIKKSLLKGRNN